MSAAVSVNVSITYTPPNAPANSGVISLLQNASYNGHNVGQIDVLPTVPANTNIPVPFAAITSAKVIAIKNNMSSEIGIKINGASTNTFNLKANGFLIYAASGAPDASQFASASIVTTAQPSVSETISFGVWGD